MIPIEAITTLGGLIIPPAFKLIKGLFGKKDAPQDALDDIALTRPEILPEYIKGLASLSESKAKWFNRDVVGDLPVWVSALRASIRPGTVILSGLVLAMNGFGWMDVEAGTRAAFAGWVSTWMSDRLL